MKTKTIESTAGQLIDVRSVAKLLGVSTRHIWSLHATGRLPKAVRLGRRVLWNQHELSEWVVAGCPSRDVWEKRKGGHGNG